MRLGQPEAIEDRSLSFSVEPDATLLADDPDLLSPDLAVQTALFLHFFLRVRRARSLPHRSPERASRGRPWFHLFLPIRANPSDVGGFDTLGSSERVFRRLSALWCMLAEKVRNGLLKIGVAIRVRAHEQLPSCVGLNFVRQVAERGRSRTISFHRSCCSCSFEGATGMIGPPCVAKDVRDGPVLSREESSGRKWNGDEAILPTVACGRHRGYPVR